MNYRIIKKLLCLILVSTISIGAAAAVEVQPRWSYILTISGDIDISSAGVATVRGNGSARLNDVDKLVITLELQQFINGKWQTKNTWTETAQFYTITTDNHYWGVAHGYSYQLYITLKAYKGNQLLETGTGTLSYGYFS